MLEACKIREIFLKTYLTIVTARELKAQILAVDLVVLLQHNLHPLLQICEPEFVSFYREFVQNFYATNK